MLRYVLRRLLIAIPTLLIISLAVFGLGRCAPGDPVAISLGDEMALQVDPQRYADTYQRKAVQLGLDKPLFYANLSTAAYPDSLWKIYPLDRRQRLSKIIGQNGNWPATRDFEAAVKATLGVMYAALPDSLIQKPYLELALLDLSTQFLLDNLKRSFQQADSILGGISPQPPQLRARMDALRAKTDAVCGKILSAKLITPNIHWHGLNNQYHHWLVGFLTGNWGLTKKQHSVWPELKPALFASMAINAMAILFAYLISIPLGVEMARRKGRAFDRWTQRILVFIMAMPVFWVGGLLVIFFGSTLFGEPLIANPYLDISDAWNMNSEAFGDWFSNKLPKFVLPILVLTMYALAIISMQMRGGMVETLGQDYIRTARAKGVREEDVYWTHAFRNAVFPIITIFASVFPAMFTGSLVIETLFNFPGMGLKAQEAFLAQDLAILSAILMAAAVLTIIGNLVADMLYAWVDPRVRYGR